MGEEWQVCLRVDRDIVHRVVTIRPPFGIRCADAEVKAIKEERAAGARDVWALSSRFMREVCDD